MMSLQKGTKSGTSETEPLFAGDNSVNETSYTGMGYDVAPVKLGKEKKNTQRKVILCLIPLILMAIGGFIAANTYVIVQRSEDFANQSVEMEIQHVELDSITTKGINVKVQGVNVVDYNGITNPYFKGLFKLGGSAFHVAKINLQTVDLETVVENERLRIGEVDIPEFTVNIANGQTTDLDMIVSIRPNTAKILSLVKHLLTKPDELLKIYGSAMLKVSLGILPLGSFKIDFQQDFIGNNYFQFNSNDISIRNLTVNEIDNTDYEIKFNVSLPNPIQKRLFAFRVPVLGWELLVQDCDNSPSISLFDHVIYSDSLKISTADDDLEIGISTRLSKLDKALSRKCKLDNKSNETPMTTLIDEFVNNKSLPVMIRNIEGSEEYPGFFNEFLRMFIFQFDYLSNFSTSKIIESLSINGMSFAFKNGDMNKPTINGEINLYLRIPKGLSSIRIGVVKGIASLLHEDVEFGQIVMDEWHDCVNEISNDLLHVKFKLDHEELMIKDKEIFGKVINQVIGSGRSTIFIDALLDCFISSLVGDFEINEIHANSDTEITRGLLLADG